MERPTRATAANGRGHLPPIHFAAKSRRTIAPDGREHYEVVIFGSKRRSAAGTHCDKSQFTPQTPGVLSSERRRTIHRPRSRFRGKAPVPP